MSDGNDSPPSGFEPASRRALFRPAGSASAGELAHMIADALSSALDAGLRDAVVDIREMTGFESPGPAFRRWAVTLWAETVRGRLRVALVARAEHLCPERTGLIVAAQEGLDAEVFLDEADAVGWFERPFAASDAN